MMVDFKMMSEKAQREREWAQTELGKLFHDFENKTIAYWVKDQDERTSDKKLRELSDLALAAKMGFLKAIRGW